jgi:AmmeMemoRadiSam system protein A
MGELAMAALIPHPPVAVPQIGGDRISDIEATIRSMRLISRRVVDSSPDRLVVISPHCPLFSDAIAILFERELTGDFARFGARSLSYSFSNDLEFARSLSETASQERIPSVLIDSMGARSLGVDERLDHGVLVPLHFIKEAGYRGALVCMGFAMFSVEDLFRFGMTLQKVIEQSPGRTAVIASGDLSHRLTPDAPAGYSPQGRDFDEQLMDRLGRGDYYGVLTMDERLVERAGECGYRSVVMLLGCMDGYNTDPQVLSYEGPFGVGYGIVDFRVSGKGGEHLLERLVDRRASEIKVRRASEDSLVSLARHAVEEYVRFRRVIKPPADLGPDMRGRAGVFCSIKRHGQLRGCIGTIEPVRGSIAEEIIHNAIAAATEDPRFDPIEVDELDSLVYSVDVLGKPEPIDTIDQLDVKRYGVIVSRGARRGLLLPDLDGVDTPEEQVRIAMQKAGIRPGEDVSLQRFEVVRHQ